MFLHGFSISGLKIYSKNLTCSALTNKSPVSGHKKALIKTCKLNENDGLDILFNHTLLGDRRPSELSNKMRHLLEAYDVSNTQTTAVLRKLFLDKLPVQARTIVAASQQRDSVINHLQKTPNALKLEHRPIPNKGVSILGDVSIGFFRLLVPFKFRKKNFDGIHSLSHPGIKGTQTLISKRYVWPGYKADIKQWCQTCITCQQSKIHKHTISPLQRISPSSQKFQHGHIDLVGPLPVSNERRYILIIVDRFSRWFEAIPLKDVTAKTSAGAFILHFVARYRSPQTITADRGR